MIAAVAATLPRNEQLAEQFDLLADLMELEGADSFRVTAYRRAATRIRETGSSVAQLALEGRAVVVRVAVAQEVPRRVDEGVHGLGLAPSLATTRGALHAHPLLVGLQRRLPLRQVVLDLRQDDRQLSLRHRDGPTTPAMDDRDRTAPVALA